MPSPLWQRTFRIQVSPPHRYSAYLSRNQRRFPVRLTRSCCSVLGSAIARIFHPGLKNANRTSVRLLVKFGGLWMSLAKTNGARRLDDFSRTTKGNIHPRTAGPVLGRPGRLPLPLPTVPRGALGLCLVVVYTTIRLPHLRALNRSVLRPTSSRSWSVLPRALPGDTKFLSPVRRRSHLL